MDDAIESKWIEWAQENTPSIDALKTADTFVDYWKAKPGTAGTKLDWFATWRNWCRREQERVKSQTPSGIGFDFDKLR